MPPLPPHIESLILAGESATVEFKSTTGTLNEAMQTICAFLNKEGGTVLIGVHDDGRFADLTYSARTSEKVAQHIRDIQPEPPLTINTHDRGSGRQVVELRVESGPDKPYTYKRIPYKRILNTTSEMPREEADQLVLARHHAVRRWETDSVGAMTVSDLDVDELHDFIQDAVTRGRLPDPGTTDPVRLMNRLQLASQGVILRVGALAFGTESFLSRHFPQCKLSFGKFRTDSRVDPEQIYHVTGNVFHLLRKAETLIQENMRVISRMPNSGMQREDTPEYPLLAVREALANAFIHRDYAIYGAGVQIAMFPNRLEIRSPGPLRFGLTVERLKESHASELWNPNLAKIIYWRGLIESFGSGIERIYDACKSNGNPEPGIESHPDSVAVTLVSVAPRMRQPPPPLPIFPDRAKAASWEETLQESILRILASEPSGMSREEIMRHLDNPNLASVVYAMRILKKESKITFVGRGAGSKWFMVKS